MSLKGGEEGEGNFMYPMMLCRYFDIFPSWLDSVSSQWEANFGLPDFVHLDSPPPPLSFSSTELDLARLESKLIDH